MRKVLLGVLLVVAFIFFFVGCDSSTRTALQPQTSASTFAFIRASTSGTGASSFPRQLSAWSSRGDTQGRLRSGNGIAPWTLDIDPGTDSVVLMRNDGTHEKVIANQAGWFDSVQISANGKKAAFSAEVSGYEQVFTATLNDLSNVVITQLTFDAENHGWPQLSSDGSKVVFMKWVGEVVQAVVMSASGGGESVVSTPGHWVLAPTFMADGNIVFGDNFTGKIMMMNSTGTVMQAITNPASKEWDSFPSVSTDGKTVVFNRNGNILTQNMDGTNLRQLTNGGSNWDPMFVSGMIVFISYADAAYGGEIYSMNADGSNLKRLTNNNVDEYFVYD